MGQSLYYSAAAPSSGEGNGNPLQYSCLENPVDGGAWWAAIHGVAQNRTRLKQLSMHALEKEMATRSSILAWRTPLHDREAWQATVYIVPKSQTLPK